MTTQNRASSKAVVMLRLGAFAVAGMLTQVGVLASLVTTVPSLTLATLITAVACATAALLLLGLLQLGAPRYGGWLTAGQCVCNLWTLWDAGLRRLLGVQV